MFKNLTFIRICAYYIYIGYGNAKFKHFFNLFSSQPCLIKLVEELEHYSPELLSRLSPMDRKQLLLLCPIVSVSHLEQTCAFDGIDSETLWANLLDKHKQSFDYDTTAVLEALEVPCSSNRERYFTFLTTVIFSGDRFSGYFEKSVYEIARWREHLAKTCLLYTSPSPRDATLSRMPSSA